MYGIYVAPKSQKRIRAHIWRVLAVQLTILARALLTLSVHYSQSMCLPVCLCVGNFDAKYLANLAIYRFVSNRDPI